MVESGIRFQSSNCRCHRHRRRAPKWIEAYRRWTLQSLAGRLDVLLFLPQTRAAFSAPHCIRFIECFDADLTNLDCSAPFGCEQASHVLGSLLLSRAIRAALTRPAGSRPSVLFVDEVQQLVKGPRQRDSFAEALALARFKKVSVLCTFQGAAQIDRSLMEILRTNCNEMAFRMNDSDARTYLHALPLPAGPAHADARRALLKTLTSLPRRSCVFWYKPAGIGAAIVQSPRVDFAALRAPRSEVETCDSAAPVREAVVDPDGSDLPVVPQPPVLWEEPASAEDGPDDDATALHLG